LAPGQSKLIGLRRDQRVKLRTDLRVGELDVRADEVVDQQVPLRFGLLVRLREVESALEAELRARRGRRAAVVRLNQRAPHEQVTLAGERVAEEELVVPGLLPTEHEAGAVVALDEHPHPAAE